MTVHLLVLKRIFMVSALVSPPSSRLSSDDVDSGESWFEYKTLFCCQMSDVFPCNNCSILKLIDTNVIYFETLVYARQKINLKLDNVPLCKNQIVFFVLILCVWETYSTKGGQIWVVNMNL